ncbi:hypothetical protein [Desulfatibacillum aliphaticivorans]|uniref:hypothetical protein n=1 Tax=Desulfatibacillum aliphaticivorans TaxID=218208 RepID=UPI00041B3206|nr:hypothetical protein [Desulfatibacillum aliphaticivorans]
MKRSGSNLGRRSGLKGKGRTGLIIQGLSWFSTALICVMLAALLAGCESYEEKQARLAAVALEAQGDEASNAAQELEDPILVAKVALEAREEYARSRAVRKLASQPTLETIALKDPSGFVREIAVAKLVDQALLGRIALEDENSSVQKAAVEALAEQELLAEIAILLDASRVPSLAVEKLTDQALLEKVAVQAVSYQARERAAEKIQNQQLLFRIALEDQSHGVRAAALKNLKDPALLSEARAWTYPQDTKKITDQALLERIATESEKVEVSRAAVEKLTNKQLLIDIAVRKGRDRLVRFAAAERLGPGYRPLLDPWMHPGKTSRVRNPDLLKEIALEAANAYVREAAVKTLINERRKSYSSSRDSLLKQDQAFFQKIAQEDEDEDVREAAVQGLIDQHLLVRIAMGDAAWNIRREAAKAIKDPSLREDVGKWFFPKETRKVKDQDLLTRIVLESQDHSVRSTAVESINDQQRLAKIAVESKDVQVQKLALGGLNDQNLLARVALTSLAPWGGGLNARVLSIQKITDQTILKKIALQDEQWCHVFSQYGTGETSRLAVRIQGTDWRHKDSRCAFYHASFMVDDRNVLRRINRDYPERQAKYARLKLALLDWGRADFQYKITILNPSRTYETSVKYSANAGAAQSAQSGIPIGWDKVYGEEAALAVFQGRRKICQWRGSTSFPQKLAGKRSEIQLDVDPHKVLAILDKSPYFHK